MDWFVLEQSQLTAYLDFRQLVHLCASTLSILTNDLNFDNLDPNINWTMFDNKSMHFPIQRQSKFRWTKTNIWHTQANTCVYSERWGKVREIQKKKINKNKNGLEQHLDTGWINFWLNIYLFTIYFFDNFWSWCSYLILFITCGLRWSCPSWSR